MKRTIFFVLPWLLAGSLFAATTLFLRAQRANEQLMSARIAEAVAIAKRPSAPESNAILPFESATKVPGIGDAEQNAVACCVSAMPLSNEQMTKLNAACTPCCAEMSGLQKNADEVLTKLEAAIGEPAIDRAKVDALVDELCEARRAELKKRVDSILLVRNVLDPSQIEMLRAALRGVR